MVNDRSPLERCGRSHPIKPTSLAVAVLVVWVGYAWLFLSTPLPEGALPSWEGTAPTRFDAWITFGDPLVPTRLPSQWVDRTTQTWSIRDRLPLWGMSAGLLVLSGSIGWTILRRLGAGHFLPADTTLVFSLGLGMHVVSLGTLGMGLAGMLNTAWPRIMVGVLTIALGIGSLPAIREWTRIGRTAECKCRGARDWAWWTAAAPFVALLVLGSILPPWDFDVREYHLQAPKEWFQQGRVAFLPHNVYGNMPLGAEMHAVLAMALLREPRDWWWGALLGKSLMGSYVLITSWGLYVAGRRFFDSTTAGAAAAVIYLSTPWVLEIALTGHNENAVALYLLLTWHAIGLAWLRCRPSDSHSGTEPVQPAEPVSSRSRSVLGYSVLAGVMAGASIACKYTGLLFVLLPAGLAVWLLGGRDRWKVVGAFALAAACSSGPWLAKNAMLTGNPIYPLAARYLGGSTRTPERIAQWQQAHRAPVDTAGDRFTGALLFDGITQTLWRSPWHGLLLVPLALTTIVMPGNRRTVAMLTALIAVYWLSWWCCTHRVDRFLVPAVPLVALLAGWGVTWRPVARWKSWVTATMALGLWYSFSVASSGVMQVDPRFLAPLAHLRGDKYRVNPVHRWLNDHASADQRVLLVGDAQPFDLEVAALYNTCFDDDWLTTLVRNAEPQQQWTRLRDQNIAYVYVHWAELDRYRQPGNYGYSSDFVQPAALDGLVRRGVLRRTDWQPSPPWGELFEVAHQSP